LAAVEGQEHLEEKWQEHFEEKHLIDQEKQRGQDWWMVEALTKPKVAKKC